MRSIDTRFWADGWIRKLNPLDRYLFLYLLTNDKTSWCGIYELDLGMMAYECGLDERDLERALLPRLSPKVIYVDGWVYIPNFPKYHLNGTDATKKGYDKAFAEVPQNIRLKIKEIEAERVVPPTHPSSASASALASISKAIALPYDIVKEDTKPKKESTAKYPHSKEVFKLWEVSPRNWTLNTTQLRAAENLYEERGIEAIQEALQFIKDFGHTDFFPSITSPYDLDSKWAKLEAKSKELAKKQ